MRVDAPSGIVPGPTGRATKLRFGGLVLVMGLCLLFTSGNVSAEERIDLRGLFSEPGVRLVAVEFWADFCKPCVESLPRWKKLHEKYRDRGLRLVMVSVNSGGRCPVPDWSPDVRVCDLTGEIAKSWFATDLPQAFLWTWQGSLLLEHATVDEVERRMEQWFADAPRLLVQQPQDASGDPLADGDGLRRLVRSELSRGGKFELVADPAELKEIRRLRKMGYEANYDQSGRCRLGMDVSPNSVVKVTRLADGDDKVRLLLEVFSLEKGCLIASSVAPVGNKSDATERAVTEAVAKLAREMAGKIQQPSKWEGPGGASATAKGASPLVAKLFGSLTVRSTPSGATVFVDGTPLGRTPVQAARVPARKVQVRIVADEYVPDILEEVSIPGGKEVVIDRELEPRPVLTETPGPSVADKTSADVENIVPPNQVVTKDHRGGGRVLPWVTAGLGFAAAGVGGALVYLGQSTYDEVEGDPGGYTHLNATEKWNMADNQVTWGWATVGTGLAVAASGLIWAAMGGEGDKTSGAISVAPDVFDGFSIMLDGRF